MSEGNAAESFSLEFIESKARRKFADPLYGRNPGIQGEQEVSLNS